MTSFNALRLIANTLYINDNNNNNNNVVIKLNEHIKPIHLYFVVAGFETCCFRIILEHFPTTYEICLIWPLVY